LFHNAIVISSLKLQLLHAHRDVPESVTVCADEVLMSDVLKLECYVLDLCRVHDNFTTLLAKEIVAASPLASTFAHCLFP
jgi:hypothetical protein